MLTHICGIQKNGTDEPVCKAEIETQMYGHQGGKSGGGFWWCWYALGDWD